jgi:hypothetical protein
MSQQPDLICQWKECKLSPRSKKHISCMFCYTFIQKNTIYYQTKKICLYFVDNSIGIGGNFCCQSCKPNLLNRPCIDLLGNFYKKIEIK